jgi:hypothetical protein
MELITRAQAKSLGLPRYFTGQPCKHGHVAERWTCACSCYECTLVRTRESLKKRYHNDPEYRAQAKARVAARYTDPTVKQDNLRRVRARYHTRMVAAIKQKGGRCAACGSTEELHFHHRDPAEKVTAVTQLVFNLRRFRAEVEKCDLLCAPCHYETHRRMREAV